VVRRLARLLTLLALVTPGVALATAGTAVAATDHKATAHAAANVTKPGILQTAWFWQTAAEQANSPVIPPVTPPEPSGVPKGDLAVAHSSNDDSSSKMSVVAFNLGALKPGATIESFSVTLTLDNSSGAANVGAPNPPVVACLPTRLWAAGEGNDYTNEPTVDCSDKATPSIKGNAWTFTISSIAQQWGSQANLGVAFVNDPANTSAPFQAVFKGAKAITALMTYSTPIVSTGGGSSTGGHDQHGSGGAGSSGSGSTGTGGGSTTPPPSFDPGSLPSSGTTTTTTPPAGTTQPPVIAGTTSATPTTVAAVAHPRPAPSSPGRGFWIAGAALALLIVCAAAVLADHQVPVPTAATTKLGQVLRERERSKARTAADGTPTLAPRQA